MGSIFEAKTGFWGRAKTVNTYENVILFLGKVCIAKKPPRRSERSLLVLLGVLVVHEKEQIVQIRLWRQKYLISGRHDRVQRNSNGICGFGVRVLFQNRVSG